MVKVATFTVATLTILMPAAVAYNCQKGLNYCGYNLLNRGRHFRAMYLQGNYYSQIYQALVTNYQPTDAVHVNMSFFHCTGGENGEIQFLYFCRGGVWTLHQRRQRS